MLNYILEFGLVSFVLILFDVIVAWAACLPVQQVCLMKAIM